jgi:hypothetical protein
MDIKFPVRFPYSKTVQGGAVREAHESFGIVSISRVNGRSHLFGSAIEDHHSFFRLTISQCQVEHSVGENRYFDSRELISVDLSAAQFAQLITSMNVGSGVPCTIRRVLMNQISDVPRATKTESENVQDGFARTLSGLVDYLKASRKEAGEILNGSKPVNQKERARLLDVFDRMVREVDMNFPFAAKTFVEATERVKVTAKAEIEATMMLFLQRLGAESLREKVSALGTGTPAIDVLPAGDKE